MLVMRVYLAALFSLAMYLLWANWSANMLRPLLTLGTCAGIFLCTLAISAHREKKLRMRQR